MPTLIQNRKLSCGCEMSGCCTVAEDRPRSENNCTKAITGAVIATSPKSAGTSSRAIAIW